MDTAAQKQLARTRSVAVEIAGPVWFPHLIELTLALPRRLAHTIRVMLRPGSTQPGRDGIVVAPMSEDWLQRSRVDSHKHGDIL